ncbi:MAG: efflux RND transporter permease subunit, partial [Gemmatimonadales bacterium]
GAGSISRRPLGYAIVGGVLFSTLLTLYVVPAVYVIFDGLRSRVATRTHTAHRPLAPAEAE